MVCKCQGLLDVGGQGYRTVRMLKSLANYGMLV